MPPDLPAGAESSKHCADFFRQQSIIYHILRRFSTGMFSLEKRFVVGSEN
jgi:hypothetical protein